MENNILNTNDIDIDYVLIYKDKKLIIDSLDLSDDDKIICNDIVDNLEKSLASHIKEHKTVSIPFIGTVQKNWYKDAIKANYKQLKEYKESHTKEEYDKHFKELCENIKAEHIEKETAERKAKKFKRSVLPKYVNLVDKKGTAYANAWLKAMSCFEVVEFDPEIEEVYERFRVGLDADD